MKFYEFTRATSILLVVLLVSCSEVVGMQVQPMKPQTAKTRGGARHIQRKDIRTVDDIASPQEIHEMAEQNGRRLPGSQKYRAGWRIYCTKAVDAIRFHLVQTMSHPADAEGFGQLFFNLGTAADNGEMPSFADPGARAGYTLEFFCRARLIADLILYKYNQPSSSEDSFVSKFVHGKDYHQLSQPRTCRVLSLGGGPGYDYVGVLLANSFGTSGQGTTSIVGNVFDYEEGWKDLVESMNTATQAALINYPDSSLKWGGSCDITKPLWDPSNIKCSAEVATSDLIICQYVVAENAKRLRDSHFCFFSDLFEEASNGTTIVITEVTPRIWPEIVEVILRRPDGGIGFAIDFLKAMNRSLGPQLVVQKRLAAAISPDDLAVCNEFRQMRDWHEKKVNNGYQRQSKKIRGSMPEVV